MCNITIQEVCQFLGWIYYRTVTIIIIIPAAVKHGGYISEWITAIYTVGNFLLVFKKIFTTFRAYFNDIRCIILHNAVFRIRIIIFKNHMHISSAESETVKSENPLFIVPFFLFWYRINSRIFKIYQSIRFFKFTKRIFFSEIQGQNCFDNSDYSWCIKRMCKVGFQTSNRT